MKITEKAFKTLSTKICNIDLISSISEYQKYIEYFQNRWGRALWFRGVANSSYKLIPKIYRKKIWKYDSICAYDITNQFIHRAKGHLPNSTAFEKWEWYQIMQHHGLPTRLLDWTEGHLIAMYFALRYCSADSKPCVWVLCPYNLNYIVTKDDSIFYTDKTTRDEDDKVIDNYISDRTKLPDYPIAIYPPHVDKRLSVQKSCFTVHGKIKHGFETLYKKHDKFKLVQLKFDGSKAVDLRNALIDAGITEATLFPDLEGLARELMYEFDMAI